MDKALSWLNIHSHLLISYSQPINNLWTVVRGEDAGQSNTDVSEQKCSRYQEPAHFHSEMHTKVIFQQHQRVDTETVFGICLLKAPW